MKRNMGTTLAASQDILPRRRKLPMLGAMRIAALLTGVFASVSVSAQARQFGDAYAGAQQTIRMYAQQNLLASYRNNYSAPAVRVEQQVWRPSTLVYSTSSRASSSNSRDGQQAPVVYEPEPYLVPFGKPGVWNPPSSVAMAELWSLYRESGGDPGRAVATAQPRAQAGDGAAMLLLSLAALQGRGLPADESKSLEWLRKAADAGEPHAALYYARAMIGTGQAERDYTLALRYAEKAQAVIPEAGLEVGLILSSGRPGVPADPARGAAAFERAARAGNPTSQFLYAICLQTGAGVARNAAGAISWLEKASDQGLPMARLRLGQAWYFGEGVPKDYGRARVLLEQAAAASEPGAFNALGLYYSDGLAGAPDLARAASYFRRGAEQGDVHAQLNYGAALLMGHGVSVDEREAARWLTRAADAGDATAQFMIGLLSLGGGGVPIDVAAGVRRLQQSAAGGFPLAFDELCDLSIRERSGIRLDAPEFTPTLRAGLAQDQPACLYIQSVRLNRGILGPRDPDRSFEYLKSAAEGGYHQAELDYGRGFLAMIGQVDASYEADLIAEARYWLTRAADHGSKQAEQILIQQGWR